MKLSTKIQIISSLAACLLGANEARALVLNVPPGGDVNGAIIQVYNAGGGTVNLTNGTYNGGINMYPNVTLNGLGTNTIIAGGTITQGYYGNNITVQNLVVDGLISCSYFSIGGSGPAGLFFGNDSYSMSNLTFNNVEVRNTSIALQAINISGVTLNSCNFHDNGIGYSHSIYFTGDYNVTMNNCYAVWGQAGAGAHLDFSQNISVPNSFTQCSFDGSEGYGILNQGYQSSGNANDIHIYGCSFRYCGQSGGSGNGIETDGGGYIEASRLEYNNGGYGVYVTDDVGLFYDSFNGNADGYYWSHGPVADDLFGGQPANIYHATLADGVNGPNNTADWIINEGGQTEGAVDFNANHSANGALTWSTVSSSVNGSRQLSLVYANGTATNVTMNMIVNGGSAGTLVFPPTGGWSTYSSVNTNVNLTTQNNQVKMQVTNPGSTCPILSALVVNDSTPSGPAAPTGLTYQALTNAPQYGLRCWIKLSWNAPSGATYYDIMRNGEWIATYVPTNSFVDYHVPTTGSAYTYTIAAVNAGGYSSAQITAYSLSGFPVTLSATASGLNSVALSCANSANATSYKAYRSTTSGGPYTYIGTSSTTSYTDTTVVGGTLYYYVMTASNGLTESLYSPEASARPLPASVLIDGDFTSGAVQFGAAVLGSAGNVWNAIAGTTGTIVNSNGVALSGVGVAISSYGLYASTGGTPTDAATTNLMSQYLFGYSGTAATNVTVSISGLTPWVGKSFTLVIYAAGNASGQGATLSLAGATGGNSGSKLTTSAASRKISAGIGVAYQTFTGTLSGGTLTFTGNLNSGQTFDCVNGFQLRF